VVKEELFAEKWSPKSCSRKSGHQRGVEELFAEKWFGSG